MNIFKEYLKIGEDNKTYQYLQLALEYANRFDHINAIIRHESLLNNTLEFNKETDFGKDYLFSEVDLIKMELKELNCYGRKEVKEMIEKI